MDKLERRDIFQSEKFIDGNTYIIDQEFANGGPVILVSHGTIFCIVRDPDNGAQWRTMLYRLTEIKS